MHRGTRRSDGWPDVERRCRHPTGAGRGHPIRETGRRPIYAGPADLFNFWATYAFKWGPLHGFGFGVGGNYSSQLNILDSQVTGVFTLPDYTVLNATLFYDTPAFRAAINVNNIADKQYYTGYSTINPQKPRNAVLSVAYRF